MIDSYGEICKKYFNGVLMDCSRVDEIKEQEQAKIISYFEQSVSITTTINEDGSITFTSNSISDDEIVSIDDTSNPIVDKPDKSVSTNLLDVMKDNNDNTNTLIENQNSLIQAQLILQADQITEQKKANKINQALVDSNIAVASSIASLSAQNEIKMGYDINRTILESNKLDFELYGQDDFLDTDGNKIVPIKSKASLDAEMFIDEKRSNLTDHSKLIEPADDLDIDFDIMSSVVSHLVDDIDVTELDKGNI
jgi:hypothetical protein